MSQEPEALEPSLGGDRLRQESEATAQEDLTPPESEPDRLAHIPESNGSGSSLSPFESRMADAMAMAVVVLGFLLIMAVGVALLVTIAKYTWGLFR